MTATDGAKGTVLVTGGSGFLGGRAIIDLLERGYDVRTTVRSKSKAPRIEENISNEIGHPAGIEFFEADLASDDGWAEAVSGCRYVLHIASPFPPNKPKDPQELIKPAREGAVRVINAALDAGVERINLQRAVDRVVHGAFVGARIHRPPDACAQPVVCPFAGSGGIRGIRRAPYAGCSRTSQAALCCRRIGIRR